MPHVDIYQKVEEMKGSKLTKEDIEEVDLRLEYAKKWLETCGPEKYIYKIYDDVPSSANSLNSEQKNFLSVLASFLKDNQSADGETIQGFIHEKKNELEMQPIDIFRSIYVSLLGKESGPKAGWLMEALDNQFLLDRFDKVSKL